MPAKEEQKSRWSDLHDLFAATREAMIVSAVILLFVAPSFVKSSLERAGITAFAGVEFGMEDVVDAGQQVALAEAEIGKLSEQLASVEQKLEWMSATGRSVASAEIREIADEVHSMKSRAESVDSSLTQSTDKIDRVIKLMPPEQLKILIEQNARKAARRDPREQAPIGLQGIQSTGIQSARLQGLRTQEPPAQSVSR